MSVPTRSPLRRWLRRIAAGLLGLVLIGAVAGSIYEAIARRRIAARYPPPGRLVDIGGRRIHLDCRGTGSPTVVFESGLDIYGSLSWARIHDSVATTTRACAYDRAGIMWSDRSDQARDGAAVATDLHRALEAGGEHGPFVMVGHSLGGPYIMTFTKRFGADVAGLVFVDASHPDQEAKLREATGDDVEPSMTGPRLLAALAWSGLPRLILPSVGDPKAGAGANDQMMAYAPRSLGPMLDEQEQVTETFREAGTFRALGDRPVVVLTALAPIDSATLATLKMTPDQGRRFQEVWAGLHEEEASWSSRSRHLTFTDASHYVHFDRPDAVIGAIREVVDSIRAR